MGTGNERAGHTQVVYAFNTRTATARLFAANAIAATISGLSSGLPERAGRNNQAARSGNILSVVQVTTYYSLTVLPG